MDTPAREVFWSIEFGWIIYILAALATLLLAFAVFQRFRLWRLGRKDEVFSNLGQKTKAFVHTATVDGLLHRKIISEPYPGIMHVLLFWGALFLFLATAMDVISHYAVEFLHGNTYLGISFMADLGGVMMLIGVGMAVYRRYFQKPDRLDSIPADSVTLGLIFIVLITGFILEGARMIAAETPAHWAQWSFLGYGFSRAFAGGSMMGWYQGLWWFHSLLIVGVIGYIALAFPRLTHLFVAPIGAFFRPSGTKGALRTVDLEEVENPGFDGIRDFSFRDLVALDACMGCGRCQEACPAYSAGKPLNPKKVIRDIRSRMVQEGTPLLKGEAPNLDHDLVAGHVGEEEIWECTTCRACEEVCPIYVEHTDQIVGLRRSLVEHGLVFGSLARSLEGMLLLGNPWSEPQSERADWAHGLQVNMVIKAERPALLYWVGCAGSYDPKGQEIARAIVNILNNAGIDYIVLGADEFCCGDPARRMGEEGLFQHLARRNIATLRERGAARIVTGCPHCYNTLKNEYPALGGSFQVVHHTELILELIREGRLKVRDLRQRVAFHDPCYLGRYNGILEQPRQILDCAEGIARVELERNRGQTFCCGGGGGQIWREGASGRRLNHVRFEQVKRSGVDIVATACPFCKMMLDDASSTLGGDGTEVKVRDIAELI